MMAKKKRVATEPRPPNDAEAQAILVATERRTRRPALAQLEWVTKDPRIVHALPEHNDAQGSAVMVQETFGTRSDDFVSQALLHLANTSRARDAGPNGMAANAGLALVGAIQPENELEAALAVQMAATYELSMEMLRRTRHADRLDTAKEYGNLATKLSRTFTAQMKTLSDWRRGGEQVVRHVHVQAGGQAVLAETVNVGGQNEKLIGQCHALGAPVFGENSAGDRVPGAGGQGSEAVPDARREKPGGAQG